ncbi:cysteine hydrolase [Paenibacillus frigoriresistens]|uniref:cysteine hydrolase family protein n=1 Tax=Paenibacillus alginolyticus TaxID=59839 RepID=UPI00156354E8|nr:cysteine hydrolase [Paenibacillus frigoriresistens]NRF94392.1 cysteine hydrolase [Paenibacillus frigoriresistens]
MALEIDRSRTAVLGLHWMNDVIKPTGAFGAFFGPQVEKHGVIPHTAKVFDTARAAKIPVIYTRVVFTSGYSDLITNVPLLAAVKQMNCLVNGTPGAEIIPELEPQPGDLVVDHCRISGFYGSNLKTLIVNHKISTLVFTGVASNLTVESTLRDAVDEGYRVILLKDCCTAASDEIHEGVIRNLELLSEIATADEFIQAIR